MLYNKINCSTKFCCMIFYFIADDDSGVVADRVY